MAKALNVNPNRMELSKLKRQLVVAKRGHKLLKDKQDALVKAFLAKAKFVWELRQEIEKEISSCYAGFLLARAQTLPEMLEQTLMNAGGNLRENVHFVNIMSVRAPSFELPEQKIELNYGLGTSPGSLDIALEQFLKLMPRLVKLAAEEKALRSMALEIERTRRRVNALEHVMIPSFVEAIHSISMKLEEMERSTLSRLMVIKEIVRSH
ncbi:MAG: V-type ATP synthase subunit D [Synergistaceae bacterium]|nr:V-type ATP synthase subunit D [Synergistaceae bacterium]